MYDGTGSILVLCTEHQLPCNCQASSNAETVFSFHHIMYYNTEKVFEYCMKYIEFKVFINALKNTQMYKYIEKYTNVYKYVFKYKCI